MIKRVVICLVCNHVAEEDRGLIALRIAILIVGFCFVGLIGHYPALVWYQRLAYVIVTFSNYIIYILDGAHSFIHYKKI